MARYLRFFVDWRRADSFSLPNCEGRGKEQVCLDFGGVPPILTAISSFYVFFFLIYSEEWRDKWRDILIVSISFESLDLDLNNTQAGLSSASF